MDTMTADPNFVLIWGAAAIAAEIQRPVRKTYHMLESGQIPAEKVGERWVAERGRLRRHLTGQDSGAA